MSKMIYVFTSIPELSTNKSLSHKSYFKFNTMNVESKNRIKLFYQDYMNDSDFFVLFKCYQKSKMNNTILLIITFQIIISYMKKYRGINDSEVTLGFILINNKYTSLKQFMIDKLVTTEEYLHAGEYKYLNLMFKQLMNNPNIRMTSYSSFVKGTMLMSNCNNILYLLDKRRIYFNGKRTHDIGSSLSKLKVKKYDLKYFKRITLLDSMITHAKCNDERIDTNNLYIITDSKRFYDFMYKLFMSKSIKLSTSIKWFEDININMIYI